jgi:hypothetical protein
MRHVLSAERQDLQAAKNIFETLPEDLKKHFLFRVVNELEPIVQGHSIEV